jgi:hypothetical protein
MALKSEEQEKKIEQLQQDVKKLKVHKKVLKEEVVTLRQQLNNEEVRAHNKTVALKNLNDFFKKQTDGLLSDRGHSDMSSRRSFSSASDGGYQNEGESKRDESN